MTIKKDKFIDKRIIFFGIGDAYEEIKNQIKHHHVVPVALVDNDIRKQGTEIEGIPIVSPKLLDQIDYDLIVLTTPYYNEIEKQILRLGVPKNKILKLGTSYSFNYSISETLDAQQKLINKNFSLISDNCWGGLVYSLLGVPFQSPFINLIIEGPNYISLLEKLEDYLASPMTFNQVEPNYSYPVGYLKDIPILFLHEDSPQKAKEDWERRLERFNWDNIFVKFESNDLALLEKFDTLPFKNKIAFTRNKECNTRSSLFLKELHQAPPQVGTTCFYTKKYISLVDWLNQGSRCLA